MADTEFDPFFQKLQKTYAPQQPQQPTQQAPAPMGQPAPAAAPEDEFGSYFKRLEEQKTQPPSDGSLLPSGDQVRHPAKPDQPLEWAEVGKQAIQNIPQSAKAYGESLLVPFTQPKETAQAIGQIGKGAYSKIAGAFGAEQDAEKKAQDEAAINAIGRFYADRYGSVDGFKSALASDPVGVLADAASVLTLGGGTAARMPGVIGKAGQVIQKTGDVIDPLSIAGKGVKGTTRAVTATLSLPEWWTTGASLSSLNTAAKAGLENNPSFIAHLTGAAKPEEAVRRIENVHSAIAKERSANLVASLGDIAKVPLSYDPVQDAINNAQRIVSKHGTAIHPDGVAALQQVQQKLDEFKANPNLPPNIEHLQDLKVAINNIGSSIPLGAPARAAVNEVTSAIRNQISALPNGVGKKYMDAMDLYGEQSRVLSEIRQNFMKGGSDAARIRKVLSSKDSKFKTNMLEEIAKYDPEIPYIVAGMELNPVFPSGIRGQISGVLSIPGAGLAGSAFLGGIPAAVGSMLVHSPRAMGAMQYGIGQVGGVAPRMIEANPMLRQIPFQAGRAEEELQREERMREGRATGGKVTGSIAQRLIAAAEKAHKYHQKTTEEILDAPDEHVVKALAVANKHI